MKEPSGKRPRFLLWTVLVIAAAAAAFAARFLPVRAANGGGPAPVPVVIANPRLASAGLVYYAEKSGIFLRHGLTAEINRYEAGKLALEALLEGKADVAFAAETPFVHAVLADLGVVLVTSLTEQPGFVEIVARRSAGIERPEDLRGRRIGVTPGTNGEYFLERFLTFYGVALESVTIVPVLPSGMNDAMAGKQVDAVCTWTPHTELPGLGADRVVFRNDSLYTMYLCLLTRRDFAAGHPEVLTKLVAAVSDAAALYRRDAGARRIAAAGLDLNEKDLYDRWHLNLDQALLLTLEEVARWALAKQPGGKTIPNFLEYLYPEALRKASPEDLDMIVPQ